VNSCSTVLDVVRPFLAETGTLFVIEVIHDKDISEYSVFQEEQEVVLMSGTRVRVKCKTLNFKDRLCIVHLEEGSKPEEKTERSVCVK
jgi:hypothetical protein